MHRTPRGHDNTGILAKSSPGQFLQHKRDINDSNVLLKESREDMTESICIYNVSAKIIS